MPGEGYSGSLQLVTAQVGCCAVPGRAMLAPCSLFTVWVGICAVPEGFLQIVHQLGWLLCCP